jgi:Asp-tRNA(Asn)/Glu-tRNA(Gln) amidotransferase A subunit family amidase
MSEEAGLTALTAAEAARLIRDGNLTSVQLVSACLDRIRQRDLDVEAWVELDEKAALAEAAARDAARGASGPKGVLHGVPVGIKDNSDALPFHTRFGSPIYRDNAPVRDAAYVAKLREAGAVILGKTVTAEFATWSPGPTRNPRAPGRTPGGSSSGSAAALADYHVPLTSGTQTVSSIVRPAAFCGIYGWKASVGRLPTDGILSTSQTLDTLGFLARSVEDLLLVHEVFLGAPPPAPAAGTLRVGLYPGATTEEWHPEMQAALARAGEALAKAGVKVGSVEPPISVGDAIARHGHILGHEVDKLLTPRIKGREPMVTAALLNLIEDGRRLPVETYRKALELRAVDRAAMAGLWRDWDLLLTPAALGPAPPGLATTGNGYCGRLWTYLGTPSIACPMAATQDGQLPLGLQTIGPEGKDGAVLQATRIVAGIVGSPFSP